MAPWKVAFEFVSYPFKCTKALGLWMSTESGCLYFIYFLFIMATQYFFALFQAVYAYKVLGDIPKFTEASYLLLTQAALCYKIYVFLTEFSSVRALVDTMVAEPLFQIRRPEYLNLMKLRSIRCKKLIAIFVNMANATIFFWAIFPILDTKSKGDNELPFKAWYPIPKDRTPYFEILYSYQIAGILISAYINGGIDFMAIGMLAFGQTQMEIVNLEFRKIVVEEKDVKAMGIKMQEKFYNDIVLCVRRHQCTDSFLKKVERTFHKIAVSQLIASVLIICITALQLVTMTLSLELVSLVLYFSAMLVQVFLYCWQGNEVTLTSIALVDAAYECTWYFMNKSTNKVLFIFLERLRRPVVIRAGKFFPLSLQMFVSVLRSSYSYFAVLQTVQDEP